MNIVIDNLSKVYSKNTFALKDITLEIGVGMFGLIGPNGAGKTTLMRIISTLVRPTNGVVKVGGYRTDDPHDKWAIRAMIGYLPQEMALYNDLTAYEFLDFVGALKKVGDKRRKREQVQQMLEVVGLVDVAHRRIKTFSGGMKRRVGIAQALLGDPAVLIVDEPTAGLDPQERVRFRNMLAGLASERLVILSSHIVEDIAHTCSRVAILHQGSMIFNGSPTNLVGYARGKVWEFESRNHHFPSDVYLVASGQTIKGFKWRVLSDARPHATAIQVNPNLEDGYLYLTNTVNSGST